MVKLCLRIAFALITMLSLAVVALLAAPYDDSQLRAFVTAPENCGGDCLLGLRPGATTLGEAMQQLQTHTWVESTQLSASGAGYGQILWRWSGRQPESIDTSHPGRVTFYWDEDENNGLELNDIPILTISVYTQLRMYSLQDWFGTPDSGNASFRPDGELSYSAAYPIRGGSLVLSTTMPCPTSLMSYWNAWTKLSMSIGRGTSDYVSPLDMVHLC
jgi:hypothetical protein